MITCKFEQFTLHLRFMIVMRNTLPRERKILNPRPTLSQCTTRHTCSNKLYNGTSRRTNVKYHLYFQNRDSIYFLMNFFFLYVFLVNHQKKISENSFTLILILFSDLFLTLLLHCQLTTNDTGMFEYSPLHDFKETNLLCLMH